MIWVLLGLHLVCLWLLWEIRRSLGVRGRPRLLARQTPTVARPDFPGAIPPNRYVVVRWPQGRLEYQGCVGSLARQVYEQATPNAGEEVEFWELGNQRGHKAG